MAERDSWATMNGASRIVDAEDTRLAYASLWTPGSTLVSARQGIRPGPGNPFKVAALSPTPGANVTVQLGQMVLTATRGFGSYGATLDATKTVAILDVPADPSNQRNDLIIATQSDTYYSDGSTAYTVRRVQGTPSGSPTDPSLSAFPDNILLARVRVTAGATAITNAMIDDLRPAWTVALGGILPVADATARGLITTPYDGQPIYRMDRDWVEIYDGTAWRVQGVAVCASTADRDSAITSPYNGLFAYTSDTGKLWQRHSGAWREWPAQPLAQMRQTGAQTIATSSYTGINFTTEDVDTNNGHDTVSNNTRYTAQIAGRYALSGAVAFAANDFGFRAVVWAKNGTRIAGSQADAQAITGTKTMQVNARRITVALAVNDYVELIGYQDTGGNLNTSVANDEQSTMLVEYVGA